MLELSEGAALDVHLVLERLRLRGSARDNVEELLVLGLEANHLLLHLARERLAHAPGLLGGHGLDQAGALVLLGLGMLELLHEVLLLDLFLKERGLEGEDALLALRDLHRDGRLARAEVDDLLLVLLDLLLQLGDELVGNLLEGYLVAEEGLVLRLKGLGVRLELLVGLELELVGLHTKLELLALLAGLSKSIEALAERVSRGRGVRRMERTDRSSRVRRTWAESSSTCWRRSTMVCSRRMRSWRRREFVSS